MLSVNYWLTKFVQEVAKPSKERHVNSKKGVIIKIVVVVVVVVVTLREPCRALLLVLMFKLG